MPEITEPEKEKRRKAVDFARGSVRLEGFILSQEEEALLTRYINGELTSDEVAGTGLGLGKQDAPTNPTL
ncbi:MAG TPA: antitoxin VbhA family protein [Rhodocyclaceae bacterium]|nr:antitoxin VbhA family protein [Rhodocyclaceae bacterium]